MASPSLTPALLSQYSAICPSPGQPNPSQVDSASAPPEAILRFLRSPSAFTQRPSVAPHCPRERVEPGIQGPRKAAPASFPTPCTPLSNLSPDAQAPPRPGSSRSVGPLAWNVCQPRRGWRERRLARTLTPWKDETPRTRPRLISTPHWSSGPLTQKSGRIPTLRPILGDVCPEAHRETKAQSEHRSWCACAEATTSFRSDAPAHEKGRSLKSPASSSPSLPESVPLWLLLEPV